MIGSAAKAELVISLITKKYNLSLLTVTKIGNREFRVPAIKHEQETEAAVHFKCPVWNIWLYSWFSYKQNIDILSIKT